MDDSASPISSEVIDVRERLVWARSCLESAQVNAKRETFSLFAMSPDVRERIVTAIDALFSAARRIDPSIGAGLSSEPVDTLSKFILSYGLIVEVLQALDTDSPVRINATLATEIHNAADGIDAAMLWAVQEQPLL